jgi:hypothetical protein
MGRIQSPSNIQWMRLKNGKENIEQTFLSKRQEAFAVESNSNFKTDLDLCEF